jgi:hypothetical protein
MKRDGISIEAQIAALADGTLAEGASADAALSLHERARLPERIERSPELAQALARQRQALARQRQALALVGSLQDVQAPPELHAAVASLLAEHASRRSRRARFAGLLTARPFALRPLGATAALAALIAALVLALAGEPASSPTVAQAARLALRAATLPSPMESAQNSHALDIAVEGLSYPYWQGSLGWRATGSRRDRLDGRTVTTVFYGRAPGAVGSGGAWIGYAIVSGRSLPLPGGAVITHAGLSFHVLAAQGAATVVTWRRAGHTCILVARHVATSRLIDLASWE